MIALENFISFINFVKLLGLVIVSVFILFPMIFQFIELVKLYMKVLATFALALMAVPVMAQNWSFTPTTNTLERINEITSYGLHDDRFVNSGLYGTTGDMRIVKDDLLTSDTFTSGSVRYVHNVGTIVQCLSRRKSKFIFADGKSVDYEKAFYWSLIFKGVREDEVSTYSVTAVPGYNPVVIGSR